MNDKCVIEHKKEITKRLGRPLIQTNPYEVCAKFLFLLKSLDFFASFNLGFGGFCELWVQGQIMEYRACFGLLGFWQILCVWIIWSDNGMKGLFILMGF